MTETPVADTVTLVASHPEHCLDCFRLIRPGERLYQGEDYTVLCPTCHGSLLIVEDYQTLTTASGLGVDCGNGLIRIRRDGTVIVIGTQEVRHLVDALVGGVARVVDEQV